MDIGLNSNMSWGGSKEPDCCILMMACFMVRGNTMIVFSLLELGNEVENESVS